MFATTEPASSSVDNWVALGLAVVLVIYLIFVLVFPERF